MALRAEGAVTAGGRRGTRRLHGESQGLGQRSDIDAGKAHGPTTDEREELHRLRRENRVLREEREILKKAAAFFARETDSTR